MFLLGLIVGATIGVMVTAMAAAGQMREPR